VCGELTIENRTYPSSLKLIPNPPKTLYYKVFFRREIFDNCLGIVGSRKMSIYGKKALSRIYKTLNLKSLTIVSGFMTGIDSQAHKNALTSKATTIAVMPCGIDIIHPENQEDLYKNIIENGGLILSEYGGNLRPQLWTYPKRNRIVAGLSRAVLIVEASSESGSLITANLANSYGRKVFTVPGSIFSDTSEGCRQLQNSYAYGVSSGVEINEYFGLYNFGVFDSGEDMAALNGLDEKIVSSVKKEPATLDEISELSELSISELSSKITLLSINGYIEERAGKYYAC